MTEAARRVLGDCKAALDMQEDEEHEQRWKVLWEREHAKSGEHDGLSNMVDRTNDRTRLAVPLLAWLWSGLVPAGYRYFPKNNAMIWTTVLP